MQDIYKSDWNECKKEIAERLRTAYAVKGPCGEIDGDDILSLLGCAPIYDIEKPFCYSTEELSYLAELVDLDVEEEV